MDQPFHSMTCLFAQLGLPSSADEIRRFIELHRPISTHLLLHEAPFWNHSQSEFLRENILNDSDWAQISDELNAALRITGGKNENRPV